MPVPLFCIFVYRIIRFVPWDLLSGRFPVASIYDVYCFLHDGSMLFLYPFSSVRMAD